MIVRNIRNKVQQVTGKRRGSIFVEYLLLLTIVGIGVLVGLAVVRTALIDELQELAAAIDAINC